MVKTKVEEGRVKLIFICLKSLQDCLMLLLLSQTHQFVTLLRVLVRAVLQHLIQVRVGIVLLVAVRSVEIVALHGEVLGNFLVQVVSRTLVAETASHQCISLNVLLCVVTDADVCYHTTRVVFGCF